MFWGIFYLLNGTFGLVALSVSLLSHAFVSGCPFKSVRAICSGWLPSLATHSGLSTLGNRRRWPSGDPVSARLWLRHFTCFRKPQTSVIVALACAPLIRTWFLLRLPLQTCFFFLLEEQSGAFALTFQLVIVSLDKDKKITDFICEGERVQTDDASSLRKTSCLFGSCSDLN